jgi:D-alanyl-D-alanine carboxypeptidase
MSKQARTSSRWGRLGVAIVAVTALVAVAGCGSDEPDSAPSTTVAAGAPAYAAGVEAALLEGLKDNAIPGVVVLVKSKQGDWSTTLGTAEIGEDVAMELDDHFRIGSNTKTMTSTVILQLVQEGKLKLDDPVSTYIPDVPNGDTITIANLSEMRSGLFSYTSDLGFNQTLDADPQKAWTPEELLEIAFSHPVTAAPDTEFDYCNTNIVLLGLIIEQLTGMSASEAFQERIFGPLGLEQSSLPANTDSSLPSPHARGYQFLTNVETIDSYAVPADQLPDALDGTLLPIDDTDANPSWAWTAGGAISTADDLAIYVKAMVGGGLLDEATQKIRMDSVRPLSESSGYGLGLAQFGPMYGHDGQLPGFSSFMVYDPEADTTIILATNLSASPVDGENAAVVLGKAVMAQLYGQSAVAGADPAQSGSTSDTTGG